MAQQNGLMSIAATHLQARHALPTAPPEFRVQFPNVKLHLHHRLYGEIGRIKMELDWLKKSQESACHDLPKLA